MRTLPFLCCFFSYSASAAVTIDPAFWVTYQPYQQYSSSMIRDLVALREGDLLATAEDIDGLELRVVGRSAPTSRLISARVVIDSTARERLQVKVLPFDASPNSRPDPALRRSLLTPDEAKSLTDLLDEQGFWDAPYLIEQTRPDQNAASNCTEGNGWIVEAFRPGTYQLISRSNCVGPDETVAEILEFLLGIAGVAAEAAVTP